MTPGEFIAKWRASELKESSAAQSHFNDLCQLLGEPTPTDADPTGDWYCFEHGARKDTGGDGWADVWKRGCFAWEYKPDCCINLGRCTSGDGVEGCESMPEFSFESFVTVHG